MIEITDKDIYSITDSHGFERNCFLYNKYQYALIDGFYEDTYDLILVSVPDDIKRIDLLSKVKYKSNICELCFINDYSQIDSCKNIEEITIKNNKTFFVEDGALYYKICYDNGNIDIWLAYYPIARKNKSFRVNPTITDFFINSKSNIEKNSYLEKIYYKNKTLIKQNNKFILSK